MGNIQEYTNPVKGLQPSEEGIVANVQAAYRGGRFFTQAGEEIERQGYKAGTEIGRGISNMGEAAVNYMAGREISTGMAGGTGMQNSLDDEYNSAISANPNDPTVAARFTEDTLEPTLQHFNQQFHTEKGQEWAQRYTESLRQSFTEKMRMDAGILAKSAVTNNLTTALNNLYDTNRKDPTNLDASLLTINGKIDPETGEKIGGFDEIHRLMVPGAQGMAESAEFTRKASEGAVKSAIYGWIDKGNFPMAKQLASKYAQYIPDPNGLASDIAQQERLHISDVKTSQELQNAQEKQNAYAKTMQYINDPTMKITDMSKDPAYRNRPDLLDEGERTVIAARKLNSGEMNVDPRVNETTKYDLLQGIVKGDISQPTELYAELRAGHIDIGTLKFLQEQMRAVQEPAQKRLMQEARLEFATRGSYFDPDAASSGGITAIGKPAMMRAQTDFIEAVNNMRANNQNPEQLLDKASPLYFFRGDNMKKYTIDLDQQNTNIENMTDMDRWSMAIGDMEGRARGGYGAIGDPVTYKDGTIDYAYGLYGVMGKNIPEWTKEYAGKEESPNEFLLDHDAQDKVFKGEFSRLVNKYGIEGAARAWYAGEGNMNNLNATDYHYGTPGPTVAAYGRAFAQRVGGATWEATHARNLPSMPREALSKGQKWFQTEGLKPGDQFLLPSGRIGTVPVGEQGTEETHIRVSP